MYMCFLSFLTSKRKENTIWITNTLPMCIFTMWHVLQQGEIISSLYIDYIFIVSFNVFRYSGVYCAVLTGFAKGLDYRPGDNFKGSEYNHSWNAVYIDDNWYLVDSHWATRYLISEKNHAENLVSFEIWYKCTCIYVPF